MKEKYPNRPVSYAAIECVIFRVIEQQASSSADTRWLPSSEHIPFRANRFDQRLVKESG